MTTLRTVLTGSAAAVLMLGVAGCGNGGDNGLKPAGTQTSGTDGSEEETAPKENLSEPEDGEPLAQVTGQDDLELVITRVQPSGGGKWIQIKGELKNAGDEEYIHTSRWAINPPDPADLRSNPASVSGALLVDEASAKTYYVLKDEEGRCVCTTRISNIPADGTAPISATFPAPPKAAKELTFQLPTFPAATLRMP